MRVKVLNMKCNNDCNENYAILMYAKNLLLIPEPSNELSARIGAYNTHGTELISLDGKLCLTMEDTWPNILSQFSTIKQPVSPSFPFD